MAIALGLLGALVASQLPEFIQQYRQRLGGAIDELTRIVQRFDADAATTGISREDAIARLTLSGDEVVRRRAADARDNAARLAALESQRREMNEAGPLGQVTHFVSYADPGVARAAMRDFEPAVPTSSAGLGASILGFVTGWGIVQLVGWPFRRWREMKFRRVR